MTVVVNRRLRFIGLQLFSLCLLLAGLPGAAAADVNDVRLQLVTLNLYHDKDDWPSRRIQIVEKLREVQPDVIALQEVIQHENLTNQAQWIAEQLGYHWYFVSIDAVDKSTRYGNALLTRHPILKTGQKLLRPLDDSRTAAFLRIDLEGRVVDIYGTHLHWTIEGGQIRAQQIADLMEYIGKSSENFPVVVAGDFNASADAPELEPLRESFTDSYGALHPNADPQSSSTLNLKYFEPRRIDHIFYERDAFQAVESEIIFDQPDAKGTWASDHYGLRTQLRLDSIESADPKIHEEKP